MPYARIGPREWEWVPDGVAYFEYTGPTSRPSHERKPWEVGETPAQVPQAARAVALGDRPVEDLPEALKALSGQPNVTGALRRLSREFGQVPTKIFVDVAEQAGVNRHTAIKQARLGRQGVE